MREVQLVHPKDSLLDGLGTDRVEPVLLRDAGDGAPLVVGLLPKATELELTSPGALSKPHNNIAQMLLDGLPPDVSVLLVHAYVGDTKNAALTDAMLSVDPSAILTFGKLGYQAVTGRAAQPDDFRGGYVYSTVAGCPIWFYPDPFAIFLNRFVRADFSLDLRGVLKPAPYSRPGMVRVVHTSADAEEAYHACADSDMLAFDTETCGVMGHEAFRVFLVSIAPITDNNADTAFVWSEQALRDPTAASWMHKLLRSDIPKVAHNAQYDLQAIKWAFGYWVPGASADTMLFKRLLEADKSASLATCQHLVGMGGDKDAAAELVDQAKRAINKRRKQGPGLVADPAIDNPDHEVASYAYAYAQPRTVMEDYAGKDALSCARLYTVLWPRLRATQQAHAWDSLVSRASQAYARVAHAGMPICADALTALDVHLEATVGPLAEKLKAAGLENPASTPQVANFLFTAQGKVAKKQTATGAPAVDAEVLEELAKKDKNAAMLLEYRRLGKLRSGYTTGMAPFIFEGRIRPSYNLDGAATGRISCKKPNLQTIPRAETAEGKALRTAFRAEPGYQIVQLDYSQLELRVAAMLSKDPVMRGIFASGVDYHQRTAEMISQVAWGITPDKVEKKHRSQAKTVNFSVLYGASARGVAHNAGISLREAERVMEAIMGKLPTLARWIEDCARIAHQTGRSSTFWDGKPARSRPLYALGDRGESSEKATAVRGSWNGPIQGTGSDYCLASVIACVEWLERAALPAEVVLTVHDSILLHVREDHVEQVALGAKAIMEGWPSDGVQLAVDIEVGPDWGDLHKFAPT